MTNVELFLLFRNLTIFFAAMMLIKYFAFLLLAAFYPAKEMLRMRRLHRRTVGRYGYLKPYRPLVSVLIPAWNEEVGIMKTIHSVIANTYENIEVIVINDGSTDDSRQLVDAFATEWNEKSSVRIRHFYKENSGKGDSLNYGIRRATGQIILTIDADSALAKNAIANLVEYFADPQISAVVGNVKISRPRNIIGLLQQLEYRFGFYFKRAHCVLGAEYIYGGACAAFRHSHTFANFGLFDSGSKTEDIELSMRTKYHGMKSLFAENVLCYTEGASTVKSLIDQRLRWKKGRFDTFARYRSMFFSFEKRYNKPLSWFILPYALLSEFQLLLEPIGATLLITYSIIANDFISLALSMMFLFVTYFVVAIFAARGWERVKLLLLFPFTWPLFYFLVWIEFNALLRSLAMIIRGDELEWQTWERKGI